MTIVDCLGLPRARVRCAQASILHPLPPVTEACPSREPGSIDFMRSTALAIIRAPVRTMALRRAAARVS